MGPADTEVMHDVFPFLKQYKDGTIERFIGTEYVPAGLDPDTHVFSEDTIIVPETGVSARLYRPNSTKSGHKLPLVIYYHGGGFFISSVADPKYHHSLNKLVAEANILLVSVDYRLAPEAPLPAALEDSWAALEWVVTHSVEEPWLKDYADFSHVFLAGDSCGANMAHHIALKLNGSKLGPELKIEGIAMINPYFWGKDPVGVEITDHFRKSMVDKWWTFICPSDKGCDDPLINPFADGSPGIEGLGCSRLVVVVSEMDVLRDRGMLYYGKLVSSGWKGNVEVMEIKGEDHVFHIIDPNCQNAKSLFKRLASFINQPS
ncbi:probable carboxylesterase 2 [Euphorbia lathyris]|uniref:probable carboxylesterase 2 n=1 Tax=Euphorbia lathyris TaxID=212925 RepID=UPI0033140272